MFAYDSITVSYARELTRVSMRYSQADGINTPLSRLMYCTHVFGCVRLCSFVFVTGSLLVMWLSSVARSRATKDASNKDNVCKPTLPAGINRPPPTETISHVTRVPDHKTLLNCKCLSYIGCLAVVFEHVYRCLIQCMYCCDNLWFDVPDWRCISV